MLKRLFFSFLNRKDPNAFFSFPVTDFIAPGYSMIIKRPMDFSTMKEKIKNNGYQSIEELKVLLIYISAEERGLNIDTCSSQQLHCTGFPPPIFYSFWGGGELFIVYEHTESKISASGFESVSHSLSLQEALPLCPSSGSSL